MGHDDFRQVRGRSGESSRDIAITRCPRCRAAIAWQRRTGVGPGWLLRRLLGIDAVELRGVGCDCRLTDDEWEALEAEADALLDAAECRWPGW